MKQTTTIQTLVLAMAFTSPLWSQVNDPVVWTFGGIYTELPGYSGIHNLDPSLSATNTLGIPMASQVAYVDSVIGFNGTAVPPKRNQVIIGHSQGGLRALAVAKDMVNQAKALQTADPSLPGPQDYLKGVITLNAPVEGFSPLAQGVAVIRNTVAGHAATLANGVSAINEAFGTDIVSVIADKAGLDAAAKETARKMLADPTMMVSAAMARLLAPGVDNEQSTAPNSALDMSRTSPWYQSNIAKSGYWTVVVVWQSGIAGFLYPTFYYVYNPGQGLIPPEVKLGYIYGDDHSFNRVAASVLTSLRGDKSQEASTASNIGLARWGVELGSSAAFYVLDAQGKALDAQDSFASFWSWLVPYDGSYHVQAVRKHAQAINAQALGDLAANLDSVVASDLGSTDNDGFIPVPDQFDNNLGSTDGTTTLGGSPINKDVLKIHASTTHFNALYQSEVWGTEGTSSVGFDTGGSRGRVGTTGAVRTYLNYLGVPATIDTVRGDWTVP